MKHILLFSLLFSTSILANEESKKIDLSNISNSQITSSIKSLCDKVETEKLEPTQLLSCIESMKIGMQKDIFFAYYVFYNASKSNVNFKNLNYDILYNKMNKMNKNNTELNLFNNIKK
jgi:hypothetical protein